MNENEEDSIYIISEGEVEEIFENNNFDGDTILNSFKVGQILGLRKFFTGEKQNTSLISKNFSKLFRIPKSIFLEEAKKNKIDFVYFFII